MGLALGLILLVICLAASVAFGSADIDLATVYDALTAFDQSTDHLIIRTVRLPRALIGIIVGAALGIAGAIMQGLTRNPLASPDILGVSAGAALAVVAAIFYLGPISPTATTWFAFIGAGAAAVIVYSLGSLGRSGLNPIKLTIAGAALNALLSSLTTGILIFNQRTLEEVRFWLAGSLSGRDSSTLLQVLPYISIGLIFALVMSRQLTTLTLGEDVAQGLGQPTAWVKLAAAVMVVLLAGSSVALAGPIGFVGLVVPHLVRFGVGVDYRWVLPYSGIGGAILLSIADVSARLLIQHQELPVGVMTTLIGAPFFVYIAQWKIK